MNKPTLCWDCSKAGGLCPWSDHWEHKPVPGWSAVQTRMRANNGGTDTSYIVLACPLFEPDERTIHGRMGKKK